MAYRVRRSPVLHGLIKPETSSHQVLYPRTITRIRQGSYYRVFVNKMPLDLFAGEIPFNGCVVAV